MSYRKFDTNTWQDPWFESLSPKAKLLFIYLWTNEVCNQAGMYHISQRRIEFEVGFKIDDLMEELKEKVYWDKKQNIIWVKNFFRWQCQNKKFAIAALNSISNFPKNLKTQFVAYNQGLLEKYDIDLSRYGIDTISIQYLNSMDTNPLSETETETETEADITNIPSGMFPRSCDDTSEASPDASPNGDGDGKDKEEKVFITIPLIPSQGEYAVTEGEVKQFQELYPAIDVREELRRLKAWNIGNPKRRKTKNGIKRHIVAWLSRAQDSAKNARASPVDDPKAIAERIRKLREQQGGKG